jgi:xanthine dehydrogenase molybdopterin binding subunit
MSHESAHLHVTGRAQYVDDLPDPPGCVRVLPVPSPIPRGRLVSVDTAPALDIPGVRAVIVASDLPASNRIGPIVHDEPVLAEDQVYFQGQPIALVVADSWEACRAGAAAVVLELEALPARFTVDEAIAADDFHGSPHVIVTGDVDAALAGAAHVIEGEMRCGAQDHFYLETQAALCSPTEDGTWFVQSSTQHPTEVQSEVATVLGVPKNRVVCEVPRMGGAFGGKESQASQPACWAALGSWFTGKPCRAWMNRDQDMCWTGKRHPFVGRYRAGFDANGALVGLDADLYANAGWSQDLSIPIVDRAMFHLDNAYRIDNVRLRAQACRTHLPSNTAFRGFGGPQGMLVVEDALNRYAETVGRDPALVRAANFYVTGDATPYGQVLQDVRLNRIWEELKTSASYGVRRAALDGEQSGWTRSGIGFQPVKFGISFTASVLNQAGALVLVYADGSVQLNHGGTEMGQGLHSKMLRVCANELNVPLDRIRVMRTATDKVPNTSATAASSGCDLNGAAVRDACQQLRRRMDQVRAGMSGSPTFAQVAQRCWVEQVSLAASGFYATPGIGYDRDAGRGTPFHYFAYGGSVTEVEVNGLTGEYRVRRVDILHDVGDSILPGVDVGQVEGAFVQGMGWLTMEEVLFDQGRLLTHGPSTYKIPAVGDVPLDLRVKLLDRATQPGVIQGSKAVGEPPFMLAISVVAALRHAISTWGPGPVELALPATPEAVLRAIEAQRARA